MTRRRPGRGWIAAATLAVAAAAVVALLGCPPAGPDHARRLRAPRRERAGGCARRAARARRAGGAARGSAVQSRGQPAPAGSAAVTPGSFMAKIRDRGYLIAGVDQNAYHFGYLDPRNGQFEGFDIDMLHAISAAIFGNPNKIRYVAISDDQRSSAVASGEVDIVAYTMTVTCARWRLADFSTVYFNAGQKVLVLRNSTAKSLVDLGGQKVCATKGSTSLAAITTAYLMLRSPFPSRCRTGRIAWCCCSRAT